MRLLDLFCGAGGASMGYHRAGFDVVGVDIAPQPNYPFEFVQADAMEYPLEGFDVIHASPPCQAYSVMKSPNPDRAHVDLIAAIRDHLRASGAVYVIENVPGAPLKNPAVLCGSMFGLQSDRGYLRRHRLFESNILILTPSCVHKGLAIGVYGHGKAGFSDQGSRTANAEEARVLMGTPWMTRDGMSQAIPPAYTEYIGRAIMEAK